MSFRDFHQRGPQPSSSNHAASRDYRRNAHSRAPSAAPPSTQAKHGTTNNSTHQLTGLLYGKLRLVPSASYESASDYASAIEEDNYCDDRKSLEHSSCSSGSISSQESSSILSISLNSNPNSPPPPSRMSTPSSSATNSSSSGRGMPGFSTQSRRRNRVDSTESNRRKGGSTSPYSNTPSPSHSKNNIRGWSQARTTSRRVDESYEVYGTERGQEEYIHATASDSFRNRTATSPFTSSSGHHKKTTKQKIKRKDSQYTELSTEVKHFQKMVAELENLVDRSGDSPETQWRSRILLRSAEEADRDIADKLYNYEKSLVDMKGHSREDRTAQTACIKLHRDFRRIHKALDISSHAYERRQQADISMLGANAVAAGVAAGGSGDTAQLLEQEQEDFFVRAMREREEEIQKVSQKMNKVNEIYQELAALVEGQQDQFDAVEDTVHNVKDNVEGGLRHIEGARDRLCANDYTRSSPRCGGGLGEVLDYGETPPSTQRAKGKKKKSTFEQWSMPFQTFHKDIKSAKKDFFGMVGTDISSRCGEIQCGSLTDVGQCGRNDGEPDNSSIYGDSDSF